jgi:hypothetical protein
LKPATPKTEPCQQPNSETQFSEVPLSGNNQAGCNDHWRARAASDSATGTGFCFNIGRVLAASRPLVTGYLTTVLEDFGHVARAEAVIYLIGFLILPFAPETKGRPLPT